MANFAADSVWFNPVSAGSGDFVVSSAVAGYRTPAGASVPNGSTIHYSARTATEFENGEGIYTSGTTTLTRATIFASSNANAKVTFGSVPTVAITPLAEDVIFPPASSNDSGIVLWDGTAADAVKSSAVVIDASNRIILGTTGSLAVGGNDNQEQQWGITDPTGGMTLGMFNATASISAHIDFYRNKAAAIGTGTVVASGDRIGEFNFYGAQQTATFATQTLAAQITCEVDGTVTSGAGADMPGRLTFLTTPDGSGTPVEALRIDASQHLTIRSGGAQIPLNTVGSHLQVQRGGADASYGMSMYCYNNQQPQIAFARNANAAYNGNSLLSANATLGAIDFYGNDGAGNQYVASIVMEVDGTPAAGNVPTRWKLLTQASGGIGTPNERVRVDNAGVFWNLGAGLGYGPAALGAGGAITQLTSRTTGVTLSKMCGAITAFAGAPVVGTWVSFTVTNTLVAATDVVIVSVKSATNTYIAAVTAVAAGSFRISFNSIAGTTSDSPVINFAVIKAQLN